VFPIEDRNADLLGVVLDPSLKLVQVEITVNREDEPRSLESIFDLTGKGVGSAEVGIRSEALVL